MKNSEFRRKLAALGAQFKEGKKHTKIYLNGAQSILPRHTDDLGTGLVKAVLKQLKI
ncbi:type II toxin-antitoxin system HicA family toxin [Acidovorax sp. 62]|uniref:type II toxin-antitoxin system HicA family toxin n=1 Tax=Acidovorax sp. 62 TaxID=2035203 RepID=UPI0011780185|nr:type II toxin-antitoxin system HicA family toxin [Acidovorax sp. 62]